MDSALQAFVAARLVVAFLASALLTAGLPRGRSACVCLSEKDSMVERRSKISQSDVVFVGTVARIAYLESVDWKCQYDKDIVAEHAEKGCAVVRVTTRLCEPVRGVKVAFVSTSGERRVLGYTSQEGMVRVCNLLPGEYSVTASTTQETREAALNVTDRASGLLNISLGRAHPTRFMTEFIVESAIKGQPKGKLVVHTEEADGSCGFGSFVPGARYEVFGTVSKAGAYTVSLCSGTRLLSDKR